jgi:hypothetical protein
MTTPRETKADQKTAAGQARREEVKDGGGAGAGEAEDRSGCASSSWVVVSAGILIGSHGDRGDKSRWAEL